MGSHGATPPPVPPPPPTTRKLQGRRPPTPPEAGEMILLPAGRTAAPRREAGAGPASTPRLPAPAGTARDKRARATAQGRHTDRARRQQASTHWSGMGATPSMERATPRTPALLPVQGRQRDGPKQGDPPPHWPPRPHSRGEQRTGRPPPSPRPPALERPRRAAPPHREHTARSQVGGDGTAPPPRNKPNGARDRGRTRGGARTAWNGPTSAQQRDSVRCARHTNQGRGGGRGGRGSASAHTHKGHAGEKRRATGPSTGNKQTAWNGVPASEDEGHPDRTARHTQRRKRGAERGKRGRHDAWHRARPLNRPGAPRTHDQGTAPAKAVVAHCATHQPQG